MNNIIILGFGEFNSTWTNPQWMAHELNELGYSVKYWNPPYYKKIGLSKLVSIFARFCKRIKKISWRDCIKEQKSNYCEVQQVINHFVKVNLFV